MTESRGRPPIKSPRNDGYRLRLNAEEREMLNYLADETGLNASEILRSGIKIQYNIQKFAD